MDDDIDINEMASQVAGQTQDMLDELIEKFFIEHRDKFEANPDIPYTVLITMLSRTIGDIVAMFDSEDQNEILSAAIKEIIEMQEYANSVRSPLNRHHGIGHA